MNLELNDSYFLQLYFNSDLKDVFHVVKMF